MHDTTLAKMNDHVHLQFEVDHQLSTILNLTSFHGLFSLTDFSNSTERVIVFLEK